MTDTKFYQSKVRRLIEEGYSESDIKLKLNLSDSMLDETLRNLETHLIERMKLNQDKELISEYETDENGMITISNLLAGLYYIKELNAPANYELLDGFMEVNIQNNVLSNLKITNRLKIEVPKTGVNELLGIILFTSVSLFGGVALYRHDKKH